MALKIVKKQDKQRIVITILGVTVGNAKYWLSQDILKSDIKNLFKETSELVYQNMFDYLCKNLKSSCEILPLYTDSAKDKNKEISEEKIQNGIRIDEKEFEDIFSKINNILDSEKYKDSEFIIDITHGFRHLPILATIASLIHNFKNADKIKAILFGKEIKPRDEYEIIDLKSYLDIANISFILSTFNENYTVSNHIQSSGYKDLINALNDFSNDIMALNISNLQKNSKKLISKLSSISDIAIKQQAINLKNQIEQIAKIINKQNEYEKLFELGNIMLERNYILLSLQLIFESLRDYMVVILEKNDRYKVLEKIKDECKNDTYTIRQKVAEIFTEKFVSYISNDDYNKLTANINRRTEIATLYGKIKTKRNSLTHVTDKAFVDIKGEVKTMFDEYEKLVLAQKQGA